VSFHLQYLGFFSIERKFRKDDPTHVGFLEDLMLFVVKGHYKKSQFFKRPT
jgi:hypothetical protein